jgi:hypothetical protein
MLELLDLHDLADNHKIRVLDLAALLSDLEIRRGCSEVRAHWMLSYHQLARELPRRED